MNVHLEDGDGLEFKPTARGCTLAPSPAEMDHAVKVFRQGTKTELKKLRVNLLKAVADHFSVAYRGNKSDVLQRLLEKVGFFFESSLYLY